MKSKTLFIDGFTINNNSKCIIPYNFTSFSDLYFCIDDQTEEIFQGDPGVRMCAVYFDDDTNKWYYDLCDQGKNNHNDSCF
jgi:hypothetical protein